MVRYLKRWRPDGTSYEPDPDEKPLPSKSPYVMPDIDRAYGGDGFVSPIDRKMISSRSQLRDHNKCHNVRQYGDVKLDDHISAVEKHHDVGPTPGVEFQWKK